VGRQFVFFDGFILRHCAGRGTIGSQERRQVNFFTNFSCEGGGQLLKHGLEFVVS
jgi:hypothetical protein